MKIFTAMINRRIGIKDSPNIVTANQIGCMAQTLASKQGVLYNIQLQEALELYGKKYYTSMYDITKAYDSVNHKLILYRLHQINAPLMIIEMIKYMMDHWAINMRYTNGEKVGRIKLYNGILQGDSLSPKLFIIAINMISTQLNEKIKPININGRSLMNHIFYMDDLKVICEDKEEISNAHQMIMRLFSDIGMEVNTSKCGLIMHKTKEIPIGMEDIPIVTMENPYKYLGIEISDTPSVNIYKRRIKI